MVARSSYKSVLLASIAAAATLVTVHNGSSSSSVGINIFCEAFLSPVLFSPASDPVQATATSTAGRTTCHHSRAPTRPRTSKPRRHHTGSPRPQRTPPVSFRLFAHGDSDKSSSSRRTRGQGQRAMNLQQIGTGADASEGSLSMAGDDAGDMEGERDERGEGVENMVIIGSGPAGYTAAIYAGRANLRPLCFEGLNAGPPGGQLMTTTEVDNFPGFPSGITGPELMLSMRDQGERWGAVFETEDVEAVDFSTRPFVVRSTTRTVRAQTVIIATGATARRLNLPSERDFWSRGISACAICDGAAPIFRDVALGVVGGGDSAVEEAVYLTKYSPKVHLFVRGSTLAASRAMVDRLAEETSVEVHLGTVVEDVMGNSGADGTDGSPLTGVLVRDELGTREVAIRGLFYAIGHTPNTKLFEDHISMDSQGYVQVKAGTPETTVEGVFAAGDVQDKEWRQAITAAGSGCTAALAAERYIAAKGVLREVHQGKQKGRPKPVEDDEETLEMEDSKSFDINKTKHRGPYAYQRLYFESDRPLMVKYISPTCGPCKALGRLLDKVVDEMADEIHFVEVDIATSPDIAQNAGITGTPTVQIFHEKALVDSVMGVKGKNVYRSRLKAALETVDVQ